MWFAVDCVMQDVDVQTSDAGINVATVSDVMRTPAKVTSLIQAGIDRVNEKAPSEAYKVLKFEILPADFSTNSGELGPTFRLQRLVVAKKVISN